MSHSHHHDSKIGFAFFLNLAFTIIEIVGGLMTNSIAILSDAFHDLGDCVGLAFAWIMAKFSKKSSTSTFTYGFKRFSLLAAIINGIILVIGSGVLFAHSITRLIHPQAVHAKAMIPLAVLGILANGAAALKMRHGRTLNEKVVMLHFIEDILGWVAILVAGCVMLVYPLPILDPILAISITLYVLYAGIQKIMASFKIFMQSVPEDIQVDEIQKLITSQPGVLGCSHIHVWSLDGDSHILTAHVVVSSSLSNHQIIQTKELIRDGLNRSHHINHCTLEIDYSF